MAIKNNFTYRTMVNNSFGDVAADSSNISISYFLDKNFLFCRINLCRALKVPAGFSF